MQPENKTIALIAEEVTCCEKLIGIVITQIN